MSSAAIARRDGDGESAVFSAALARRDGGREARRGCGPPGPVVALQRRRGAALARRASPPPAATWSRPVRLCPMPAATSSFAGPGRTRSPVATGRRRRRDRGRRALCRRHGRRGHLAGRRRHGGTLRTPVADAGWRGDDLAPRGAPRPPRPAPRPIAPPVASTSTNTPAISPVAGDDARRSPTVPAALRHGRRGRDPHRLVPGSRLRTDTPIEI